jgi:DNA segregation ATPase FtsK/SpoIIIE, S-DNA-T family
MTITDFIKKHKTKSRLLDCFRSAGLYLTLKRSDKVIHVYPKIHAIVFKPKENSTEVTFTLLNGIDPKEISKKMFCFYQYFGRSIDLKGDIKKYTLTIYNKPLQSNLIYSYKELTPYLDRFEGFPIMTGQKKNGRYLILDALELPHVLLQGTTGSGKSSAIRVILTTLIKYFKHSELDIYCIDGKKAEFGLFKKVEHVQSVVHSNKHARETLSHIVKIMKEREDLLDVFDVPHVNDLPEEHRQKYILIAVDEFIEYMDDKKIMEPIIKITSKGRALGIFLLASAQRMDA